MSKVSRVNARLFAKMHLRQVDTLIRIAAIENGIARRIDGTIPELVNLISKKDMVNKSAAFAGIIENALKSVVTMMRQQLPILVKKSHESAVEVLDKSLPRKLIERMAPLEVQSGQESFAGATQSVYEDVFNVPPSLSKKKLSAEEKHQARLQILFPPPTQDEVARIVAQGRHIAAPGGTQFETWEQRFDGLSSLITNKRIAFNEIASGFAEGENIAQIRRRLEPVVGGIKASAQRIARTEGMRIAEHVQRSTWDAFGDMMTGAQVVAVLDERTRPEHATRNGRIYYRNPPAGQKSMAELPDLPDAPNCRCMTIPVMEPPEEFKNDPAIREAFEKTASPATGEPASYDEWFQDSPPAKRKMVTGVERYQAVERALAGSREPQWSDFIDGDGNLLPASYLASETAVARTARTQAIDAQLKAQRELLLDVQRQGFVTPPGLAPPPIVPPTPGPTPPATSPPAPAGPPVRIDPSLADKQRDLSRADAKAGTEGKRVVRDMEARVTPANVKAQIDVYNQKTRDVTDVREGFLEKLAPDKKALRDFEKLKAEWKKVNEKIMELVNAGEPMNKVAMFKAGEAQRLQAKYGSNEFFLMLDNKPLLNFANAQTALAEMINPAGSNQVKVRTTVNSSNPKVQQRTAEAQDWLNALIPDGSPIKLDVKVNEQTGRAYASPAQSLIVMRPDNSVAVYVHEIAHIIEDQVGETAKAAKALRFVQTVGEETQHLKSVSPVYDDKEISMGKDWKGVGSEQTRYVSKYYYADSYTEVVSVGFEQLYYNPGKVARENPEFFDFLVNVLQGNYAK